MKIKYAAIIVGIFALVLCSSAAVRHFWPETKIVDRWHPAPEPKIVTKIKRVKVPVKEVVTLEKETITDTLNLGEGFKMEENKQVTAVAEVPPYEGKTQIVSIFDTETGVNTLQYKHLPPPTLSFPMRGYLASGIGISSKHGVLGVLQAQYTPIQVSNFDLTFQVEANTEPDARGLALVRWRF